MNNSKRLTNIRALIAFFMLMLALSGITAFAPELELKWLLQFEGSMPSALYQWIQEVYNAISETNSKYPFLMYGYDWLAFAHLVIALVFIGPYKDPQKNIWVINWAIIACICVLPLALIAGPIRGIPLYWQFIDCAFGVFGIIPLLICRRWIKQL
ncbi:hypothetical protein FC093_05315 [Ilyomonas limi]|uniref:Uncharacterized protein n=1 Tax=Ilyomonas limi TaxID=2575867 RepID=A0A4U3L6V4_9BACT|nr:hypothetical protein [Ilyomonas limi]TKK70169.1 hypothetical protein FC093_05315 [Ilyomonas limi]